MLFLDCMWDSHRLCKCCCIDIQWRWMCGKRRVSCKVEELLTPLTLCSPIFLCNLISLTSDSKRQTKNLDTTQQCPDSFPPSHRCQRHSPYKGTSTLSPRLENSYSTTTQKRLLSMVFGKFSHLSPPSLTCQAIK